MEKNIQITPVPPFIAILEDCDVEYVGRAKAISKGKSFIIIIKADRTVLLHSPDKGMKPVFYNPTGELKISKSRSNALKIHSSAKNGETLHIIGTVKELVDIEDLNYDSERILQSRIGTEKWMVEELKKHPEILGLAKEEFKGVEMQISSGRIDLLFNDVIVEVKKRAGARTYDQLSRYLRGSELNNGIIVCLKATKTLKTTVKESPNITLIEKSEWTQINSEIMKENY